MDELPDDQVQLIEQMHRKHIGIGAGLIAMVEKFLMDEERMDAVIECMTIKDARDLLDLGVKLQRSAVAAMGNRNPGSNEEDNRKQLAQRVLKNLSLLDQLHALSVDDEVDPNDIVEGVFVNVNARDEVKAARDMIVRQPHQGSEEGRDEVDTDTNIPAVIRKPR
jgi:MoxR-like ATPase